VTGFDAGAEGWGDVYEAATDRDPVLVMEYAEERVPGRMSPTRALKVVGALRCRATELVGEQAARYAQRGFKAPWVILFSADPGVTPEVSVLRVTDQAGVDRYVEAKSCRLEGGVGNVWCVLGDEVTQTPYT
jgi:hypothetical protein